MFKGKPWSRRRGVPISDSPDQEGQEGIPLTALAPGQRARVVQVGGFSMSRHMASLGIYPGSCLKLIRGGMGHTVIVEAGGTRLVVGRGMAPRILVLPLSEEDESCDREGA